MILNFSPDQDSVQLVAREVIKFSHATVRLLEYWAEHSTLEPLDPDSDENAKTTLLDYIELYKLASDNDVHPLMNDIMDKICERPTCEEGYFPVFFVNACYKSSTPGEPLRRFLVDAFVFKTLSWDDLKRVKLIKRHMDASHHNQTFVVDCDAKKTDNMRTGLTCQDPNDNYRCEYHVGYYC